MVPVDGKVYRYVVDGSEKFADGFSAFGDEEDISSGARDLTQRLIIKGNSELDELSKAYNDVIEQLQGMVREITKSIKTLSENSSILLSQNNETVGSENS